MQIRRTLARYIDANVTDAPIARAIAGVAFAMEASEEEFGTDG